MHEAGALGAHNGAPLQIRTHEYITQSTAIVFQRKSWINRQIQGNNGNDHVHAPLAAGQNRFIGLIDKLTQADPGIQILIGGTIK